MSEPLQYERWSSGEVVLSRVDGEGCERIFRGNEDVLVWFREVKPWSSWIQLSWSLLIWAGFAGFILSSALQSRIPKDYHRTVLIAKSAWFGFTLLGAFVAWALLGKRTFEREDGTAEQLIIGREWPVGGRRIWVRDGHGKRKLANLVSASTFTLTGSSKWLLRIAGGPKYLLAPPKARPHSHSGLLELRDPRTHEVVARMALTEDEGVGFSIESARGAEIDPRILAALLLV